ncbi:hypothetical protein I204_04762 [Kwoniella mangroviensis CBS 8886]|nr:hypothetical protein I204_04762 [Kwoniella mangroviensis CBS 8886]
MTNSNSLRHKRSQAKGLISIPFPTSSSTFMFDSTQQDQEARPRFSGESLTPNDGYSGLFTSGMFPNCVPTPSPTLSSFPSPPKSPPVHGHEPLKSAHLVPPSSYPNNNFSTPQRRRRSSIIHTTASSVSPKKLKSVGVDNGVERALEGVMRNLRVTITPKKHSYNGSGKLQSRWSSSTEGSSIDTHENNEDEGGLFKPRKSNETSRSKVTIKSTKSTKSKKDKGRKSEDTDRDRMDLDIPFPTKGVPEVPPVPSQIIIPTTPGRSRRMMNGLVKRLGLTPKKNKQSIPPTSIPPMPEFHNPLPSPLLLPLSLPLPPSIEDPERTIPRKSSFGTIRSALTKKSSNTTLRSMRSAAHPTHPFANIDNCTPPLPLPAGLPRPSHHDDLPDFFPSTPKGGRRTPKSSIGQPKLQPNQNLSPSHFLKELPRRAPETPKRDGFDIPRGQDGEQDGVIRFEQEHLGDIIMSPASSRDIDNPPDLEKEVVVEDSLDFDKSQEIFTPISKPQPNARPTQAQIVIQQTLNSLTKTQSEMLSSPFQPSGISTPTSLALSQPQNPGGKGRPNGLGLNIGLTKNKSHIQLGSPLNLTNIPLNSMGTAKLRSKKSTEGLGLKSGGPLSMKNVNSMGLPAPAPASSNENKIYSRMSRKDPLGIMKRFKPSMKPSDISDDMPYRGGAGDGWSTPIPFPEPRPSGERERKLNLGTVESYFDPNLGTFGTPRSIYPVKRGEIPDFTVPPPPDSNHSSYTTQNADDMEMEMEMENTNCRFEDADQQQGQSPEYYFQLERPSQDDIDIGDDVNDGNDDGKYGLGRGYGQDNRIKKSSDHTIHTIHTMTTGEGVEEWELERYLRDLEREEESRVSSRRGEVV